MRQWYFTGPVPFSWEPENVEVVGSGNLAMSSGAVRDPSGKRTGTFNSVWRMEAGGNVPESGSLSRPFAIHQRGAGCAAEGTRPGDPRAGRPAAAVTDQIRAVAKARLRSRLGVLREQELAMLEAGLRQIMQLG